MNRRTPWTNLSRGITTLAGGLMAIIATTPVLAAPAYQLTDLGSFGGSRMNPMAINNHGMVVGGAIAEGANITLAFRWDAEGGLAQLPAMSSNRSAYANDINDDGLIVGQAYTPSLNVSRAVSWSPPSHGFPSSLFVYNDYAAAVAVNDHGVVAGNREAEAYSNGTQRAFAWDAEDGVQELEPVSGTSWQTRSTALAINDAGIVVGSSGSDRSHNPPVRWMPDGSAVSLFGSEQRSGRAVDINNAGEILITSGSGTATWTQEEGLRDLISLDSSRLVGRGLNEHGFVVGVAREAGQDDRPFAWSEEHGTRYLQDLLDASGTGWQLLSANAVNDHGWIVGEALVDGDRHGYMLQPIPEPTSLILVAGSAALLLTSRRRTYHR